MSSGRGPSGRAGTTGAASESVALIIDMAESPRSMDSPPRPTDGERVASSPPSMADASRLLSRTLLCSLLAAISASTSGVMSEASEVMVGIASVMTASAAAGVSAPVEGAGEASRELGAGEETLLLRPPPAPPRDPGPPAFLSAFLRRSAAAFLPPRFVVLPTTEVTSETSPSALVPASLTPSIDSRSSPSPPTGSISSANSVGARAKRRGRKLRRKASILSLSLLEIPFARSR